MMVPMSLVSSSGSPSLSALTFCPSALRKLSKMSRCRKRREPAVQDWLCRVKRIAAIIPSITQSSFASGKTIEGLLPPSSSDTGTMRSEAARMMSLPTSVEPVKESLLTIGWLASEAPHFLAEPGQHVERARRQEFLTYFTEHQHAERCILCGLQDER